MITSELVKPPQFALALSASVLISQWVMQVKEKQSNNGCADNSQCMKQCMVVSSGKNCSDMNMIKCPAQKNTANKAADVQCSGISSQAVRRLLVGILNVRNGITDSADFFCLIVRNSNVEFLFKFHN